MSNDCIICSKWPERDRWALREMIDSLPLQEEPVCDDCLRVFRAAVWRGEADGPGIYRPRRPPLWPRKILVSFTTARRAIP